MKTYNPPETHVLQVMHVSAICSYSGYLGEMENSSIQMGTMDNNSIQMGTMENIELVGF